MTFHILINSTTADAADENDNFYHIGQGSRLPLGGVSLTATDSVFNLGSDTYKWANIYADNAQIDNLEIGTATSANNSLWFLEAETTLNSQTTRIEFTGLNGDTALEYMIIARFTGTGTSARYYFMGMNTESSTNYGFQILSGETNTAIAGRTNSTSAIRIGRASILTTTASYNSGIVKINLHPQTGIERTSISMGGNEAWGTNINGAYFVGGVWDNAVDTITALTFYVSNLTTGLGLATATSAFQTGTHIEIWKRA
jgi:hypothetical protein